MLHVIFNNASSPHRNSAQEVRIYSEEMNCLELRSCEEMRSRPHFNQPALLLVSHQQRSQHHTFYDIIPYRALPIRKVRKSRTGLTTIDTPQDVSPTISTLLECYHCTTVVTHLGTEFTESRITAATAEIETWTAQLKAERERHTQLLIEQQREEAALGQAKQAEREVVGQLHQQRAAVEKAKNVLLKKRWTTRTRSRNQS